MAEANVTLPHAPSQPSARISGHQHRRAMLGSLAAAPVAAAAPAVAMPADPHVEWYAEWRRLNDYVDAHPERELDLDEFPEWRRACDLRDLIIDTPAATNAGMIAQCEVALELIGANDPGDDMNSMIEVQALRNIRATLAGRA